MKRNTMIRRMLRMIWSTMLFLTLIVGSIHSQSATGSPPDSTVLILELGEKPAPGEEVPDPGPPADSTVLLLELGDQSLDELPVLSINDVMAEEKDQKMTFTVTLSGESAQEVIMEFDTVDDTAVAGSDYTAKSGTVAIPAGTTTAMIEVVITLDENRKENDEIFFIELKQPQNATLQAQRGKGTIRNTSGSFINRALGRPIPEPSTVMLMALGLLGIGLMAKRKTR